MKSPVELAGEIFKMLGDVDYNTALTAIKISKLLLSHREVGAIEFVTETINEDHS